MPEHQGNSSLFAIFALSIYSLFLAPFTIYHFCNAEEGGAVQSYQGKKKQTASSKLAKKIFTRGNIILLGLWAVWFLLLWYINASASDLKPFDPFEILEISRDATDKEIKKAYRQLSLKFHPDKNPDPKTSQYFAEFISKAYAALTDQASIDNYRKHGHPDGPQAMNVGVALPEWIFPKDKRAAAMMLLVLVGLGILLPMALVSWHMLSSTKFSGPNGVMQETLALYYHSKFNVKESQSLVRIPETLVCAMEFIIMPTPAEQEPALQEVRKMTLRNSPELKDKTPFWGRKASVLKAHMLLLAYLERESASVPAVLQPDMKFVLLKAPMLLEEMLKIAVMPRGPSQGWLTPSVAVVEMMQCLSQALSLASRKPTGGKAQPGDSMASMLQLPHFDGDVLKKLKRGKVNTLKELLDLNEGERQKALDAAGLSREQIDESLTFLAVLPNVSLKVTCEVDSEEEIMEGDVAKCVIRVMLTRLAHNTKDFEMGSKGKAVGAFTPPYPGPREESWHFFLTDPSSNSVMAWNKVTLQEAEQVGFDHPELSEAWSVPGGEGAKEVAGSGKALATANRFISRYSSGQQHKPTNGALTTSGSTGALGASGDSALALNTAEMGQVVELNFACAKAGKFEFQLLVMSDCYAGVDRMVPVRIKVVPLTRAAAEGRDARSQTKPTKPTAARPAADDDSDADAKDDSNEGSASEDDDDGEDHDSDETGELETGPETESGDEGGDDAGSDNEEPARIVGKGAKKVPVVVAAAAAAAAHKAAAASTLAAAAALATVTAVCKPKQDVEEEEVDVDGESDGEEVD